MKIIKFFLLAVISGCAVNSTIEKPQGSLDVFLMSSFTNDSIAVSINSAEICRFRVTTSDVLGQAKSITVRMGPADSIIKIRDIIRERYDSVRYQNQYPYLYIFYEKGKFTFNYDSKPRLLE